MQLDRPPARGSHPMIMVKNRYPLPLISSAIRLESSPSWTCGTLTTCRFQFILSYKPDVLSCLYELEPTAKELEPNLPPDCVVGLVTWQIEKDVQRVCSGVTIPDGCPRNWLFVRMRCGLGLSTGHIPHCSHAILELKGLFVVQQRFWWPFLAKDVADYVAACSVCAKSKASRQARTGLLQALPVPHRLWSHISIAFVTGLPPSRGYMAVLTVVDRFSKMAHFIPLPKLPIAKETADCRRRPASTYTPGQRVWLSTKDLPLHVHARKLAPRFVDPLPVSKVNNPVSVQLKLPRCLRVHPTFHVSKLKPVRESLLVPPTKQPPPLKMVDGGPIYAVKLLAVREGPGKTVSGGLGR
ncbi:hypothetical protein L3Q82_018045, partial [Scortum barcoo]